MDVDSVNMERDDVVSANTGGAMRKVLVILIAVAALGGLLFALRASQVRDKHQISVPANARAGDLTLVPGTFEARGVTYRADEGTLVVPENRNAPGSRLIALPVKRIRSPHPTPSEPIVWLTGGPGESNMVFKPPAWLLAKHDFVLVGYRGVDGTPKLDSPEVAKAMKGLNGNLLSPESIANLGRALAACAARLRSEGVDLAGYTIPETVADMEAARQALGYARVDLLSGSYGTRVAQIYAYLHPERLHRSAMIAINPPGHCVWEPAVVDAQLRHYADLCRRDDACRVLYPDLAETMRRVNRSMPKRWLFVPIDSGKVRTLAFPLLFHRHTAAWLFDAYRAAENGDPSGLALMSVAFDWMVPSVMTWGDFFAKGCSADLEPGRNYARDLDPPDSILGSPLSLLVWAGAAQGWPDLRMAEELRHVHRSAVETLLVSGSVDFASPAETATRELLPSLSKGRQVILRERGHTGDFWGLQREAAERLLTSFYDTGVADDSLYTYLPMDFKPSKRFPVLAKQLLGAGVSLIVLLAAASWAVVSRLRRRRKAAL
jgi:pimeloyl-ACP methyl ester carboxylesterase